MPAIVTHLGIAQEVSSKLKICDSNFDVGALIPDFFKDHKKAHFSENRIPNIFLFLKQFENLELNHFELGILCHLLCDKFYNEFMFANYIEIKENRLISIEIDGKRQVYEEGIINKIKHSVYENYDNYLIHKRIVKPVFPKQMHYESIEKIDSDYLITKLKEVNYKLESESVNNECYIFSNKTEMDTLYNDCIQYIVSFIETYIFRNNGGVKVGIDFDGTITEYYKFEDEWLLKKYNLETKDVTVTSFENRYGVPITSIAYEEGEFFKDYFANVQTKDNVVKSITFLEKLGVKIYIVTNRKKERKRMIEDYLKKKQIVYDEVICLGQPNDVSKLKYLMDLDLRFHIDDNPFQVKSISECMNVICMDDEYNKNVVGTRIYHAEGWNEVLELIVNKGLLLNRR